MQKKILIIEDDVCIHNLIKEILNDYLTYDAYSGTEGMLLLSNNTYDLIILDLMLPGLNGENIIRKYKDIPIIVVSAKESVITKVDTLDMGARDYITKPFNKEELLARVKVQLRSNNNYSLKYKELELLNDNHTLLINNNEVSLTKMEYIILKELIYNQESILSKDVILNKISEELYECDDNSLRVHLSNIRKKIKKYSNTNYIESIWGIGFRLKSKS